MPEEPLNRTLHQLVIAEIDKEADKEPHYPWFLVTPIVEYVMNQNSTLTLLDGTIAREILKKVNGIEISPSFFYDNSKMEDLAGKVNFIVAGLKSREFPQAKI